MGEDCSDCARVAAGRLGSPSAGIEMLEDELVDPVIDGIRFQQSLAKIGGGQSSSARYRISSGYGSVARDHP